MIRSKDLNKEIKVLETKAKEDKATISDVVKAVCLVAKVVRDIKTNQVLGLQANKVELIKPGEDVDGGAKKEA